MTRAVCAAVNGVVVHLNDLVALLAVGSFGSGFHVIRSLISGDDVGQFEERRLQNGVDSAAQTNLTADLDTVDGVELDVVVCDVFFIFIRQSLLNLSHIPAAVEQERTAVYRSSTMSYLPM